MGEKLNKYHSMSGVYKITNLENNKCYIGVAINMWTRWKNHTSTLKKNHHYNKKLQNDWNIYGEKAFIVEKLESCNIDCFKEKEQFWMDYYLCHKDEFGYNKHKYSGHSLNKFKSV